MVELVYRFKISEDAFKLLKELNINGYLEYRDTEYDTLEDFKKSDDYLKLKRTEEWFLNRNSNGTFYLANELYLHNLIEDVEDSWHTTYRISNFGISVLEQNIYNNEYITK